MTWSPDELVKALRQPPYPNWSGTALMRDAADMIDNLRAELARQTSVAEHAENERLSEVGGRAYANTCRRKAEAAVGHVRELCDDPGGPDTWSFTHDGRHALYADDILAAIERTGQ